MIGVAVLLTLSAVETGSIPDAGMRAELDSSSYEQCVRTLAEGKRTRSDFRYSDELFSEALQTCGQGIAIGQSDVSMTDQTRKLAKLYIDTLEIMNAVPGPERQRPPLIVQESRPSTQEPTRTVHSELDPFMRKDFGMISYPLMICLGSVLNQQEEITSETMQAELDNAEVVCEPVAEVVRGEAFRLLEKDGRYGVADDFQLRWQEFNRLSRTMVAIGQFRQRGLSQGAALGAALEDRNQ